MMKQGRLGYNSSNGRYGLLSSDLWIDTGFHCGEGLEVLVDDEWVQTRMERMPLTKNGKIDRKALTAMYQEEKKCDLESGQ